MSPRMCRSFLSVIVSALLLLTAAGAAFAAITVTEAKIEEGRLKVKGKSLTGTHVKLDNLPPALINGRTRGFAYDVVYHPGDCIVDLKLIGAVAPNVKAVVALCGPRGLRARGAWITIAKYYENDLVTYAGSSWQAKRLPSGYVNLNKTPGVPGNNLYWEKLAARGARGPAGPEGRAGPEGPQGPTGADGAIGPQGPAGADGAVGPQGPAGPIGADGAIGPQGPQGPAGPAGADGANGAIGPQGPRGPAGLAGADGADGAAGPQGSQGPAGPAGADGANGAVGSQGPAGPAGADGAAGPQGPAGLAGADGAIGPQGPAGPQGPPGLAGLAGADGAAGPQGPAGPAGADGADGVDGAIGPQGPAGAAGADGVDGAVGPQGPAGADGTDGVDGAVGPQGLAGINGVSNYLLVLGTASADDETSPKTVTATCTGGTSVLGGGFSMGGVSDQTAILITSNYPSSSTVWSVTGWLSTTAGNTSYSLKAYAICGTAN